MPELPNEAKAAVLRIEALLDEARRLAVPAGAADEAAFALEETERRYLPDTLAAYLNIPASQRDAPAAEMLLGQLALLERATGQRVATRAEAARAALAANGSFLSERFGAIETLPEAAQAAVAAPGEAAPSRTLVARLFAQLDRAALETPAALIGVAADRFSQLLPALTTVKRGLFAGSPRAVAIDVPHGDHALRYSLLAARGGIEASCTKLVRGIALRTERIEVGEWLRGLFDDVGAYVERDRATRELLTSFFRS